MSIQTIENANMTLAVCSEDKTSLLILQKLRLSRMIWTEGF